MVDKRIAFIFLDRDEQTEVVTSSIVLTCSLLVALPSAGDFAGSISLHRYRIREMDLCVESGQLTLTIFSKRFEFENSVLLQRNCGRKLLLTSFQAGYLR